VGGGTRLGFVWEGEGREQPGRKRSTGRWEKKTPVAGKVDAFLKLTAPPAKKEPTFSWLGRKQVSGREGKKGLYKEKGGKDRNPGRRKKNRLVPNRAQLKD